MPPRRGINRAALAKKLEHAAHCFYGEQYGDAPLNAEMVEFAAKFAACQLTGYKTEEEIHQKCEYTQKETTMTSRRY